MIKLLKRIVKQEPNGNDKHSIIIHCEHKGNILNFSVGYTVIILLTAVSILHFRLLVHWIKVDAGWIL